MNPVEQATAAICAVCNVTEAELDEIMVLCVEAGLTEDECSEVLTEIAAANGNILRLVAGLHDKTGKYVMQVGGPNA